MNTLQRLLSNTALAFLANIVVRLSSSLLFILIGRQLGPASSGAFSLGTTYYTIALGLSGLGLAELFVREVAPRRESGGRYLVNFIALRLLASVITYLGLLLALRFLLPYSPETEQVILILSLAVIPEAIPGIFQALFEAHERLLVPAAAAIANALIKLIGGYWLLSRGGDVSQVAWTFVIAACVSLLIYLFALPRLLRETPQREPLKLDAGFSLSQLRQTRSFFAMQLFIILDFQIDIFLISLFLGEEELGWYTAAQTIVLAVGLLPAAFRSALYPLMARYNAAAPEKLTTLHQTASRYLLALALPIAAGIFLLAEPIIALIFGPEFLPGVPALRWSIGSVVFAFLNVPSARLLLVKGRQRQASMVTALGMSANFLLNLLLIPRFGITGAGMARLGTAILFFIGVVVATRGLGVELRWRGVWPRPLLATVLMVAAVWPLVESPLLIPIVVGMVVYLGAALLLGVVPYHDLAHWRTLYRRP